MTTTPFETWSLPAERDVVAPDGSAVRILLQLGSGGMAHFELAPGQTSRATAHRTFEEIWYFLEGRGEMWRKSGDAEEVTRLEPGVCLTVPLGTRFQFRSLGTAPLKAVAVTMPPWPGENEASIVEGKWVPEIQLEDS